MAYNPEEDIKVSDLPEKTTDVVSDDKLLVIDSEDANILKQVDASKVGGGGSGYTKAETDALLNAKQDTLVSATNIKTINNQSLLGSGNITIEGGSGGDGTTKTFIVGGASTIAKGQEILDWYRSGKNPIVMYEDRTYYLTSCDPTGTTNGKMILSTVIGYENSLFNTDTYKKITIEFDNSDTVTTVGFDIGPRTNGYLDTRTNYSTPYTPLYDGSPATKKYVDDAVAGGGGGDGNSKTFIIDENNNVSSIGSLVVSWYREGKNPIIFNKLSGMTFILSDTTTERDETILKFNSTTINRNNSETELNVGLWITYETATGDFRLAEFQDYGVKVLSTNMNYTTPYTPLFDGSPATKKYVDDAVAKYPVYSFVSNDLNVTQDVSQYKITLGDNFILANIPENISNILNNNSFTIKMRAFPIRAGDSDIYAGINIVFNYVKGFKINNNEYVDYEYIGLPTSNGGAYNTKTPRFSFGETQKTQNNNIIGTANIFPGDYINDSNLGNLYIGFEVKTDGLYIQARSSIVTGTFSVEGKIYIN